MSDRGVTGEWQGNGGRGTGERQGSDRGGETGGTEGKASFGRDSEDRLICLLEAEILRSYRSYRALKKGTNRPD